MFKILSTNVLKKVYKMQHLEGSGTPVQYVGRTVLKVNFENQFVLSVPYKFLSNTESYYYYYFFFIICTDSASCHFCICTYQCKKNKTLRK